MMTMRKEMPMDKQTAPDPTTPGATVEDVPLDDIHLTFDTQARVAIDGHLVKEYAEAMREGATFPPVVLFRDAEGYWVGDGHHRCRAAQQVGLTTIQAQVREGGWREAFLYACSANATHGRRLDDIDKRHVISRLLEDEEWGQWSSREIARRCAVSHTFVDKIRADMAPRLAAPEASLTGNVASERTYTTKHGTVATMDTARIGSRPQPPTNGTRPAARRRYHPIQPDPLSAEAEAKRRWDYAMIQLSQVFLTFGRDGGVKTLLGLWTAEERARAMAQLDRYQDRLARLKADLAAADDDAADPQP
jgi:hypothetical protein